MPLPVQVVGIFGVNDPHDPYWFGDPQMTTGIVESGSDRVLGPFLTTPEGILQNPALTSVHMQWRAFPDFNGLTVDNVAGHPQPTRTRLPGQVKGKLSGS